MRWRGGAHGRHSGKVCFEVVCNLGLLVGGGAGLRASAVVAATVAHLVVDEAVQAEHDPVAFFEFLEGLLDTGEGGVSGGWVGRLFGWVGVCRVGVP